MPLYNRGCSVKDLRQSRWLFFQRLDDIKSPQDLLAYQRDLAEAIREAERGLRSKTKDKDDLRFHIDCLRLYADALVWQTLHPHTIRQLAKSSGHPPSLLTQGPAFDNVLETAAELTQDTPFPALIADITNVIKIGDVIHVTDPECPIIVECKSGSPKPHHAMQGRSGRQFTRAMRTAQYLAKGVARIPGEQRSLVVIETDHCPEHNWQAVEELCAQAVSTGRAFRQLGPDDYAWALRPDLEDTVFLQALDRARALSNPAFGTSGGLMARHDGLFPPPPAWSISQEVRFQLVEGTIILFHLLSADTLAGNYDQRRAISIRKGDYPILVTIDGQQLPPFSTRFIYNVVYAFETVPSCVTGLLAFAQQVAQHIAEKPPRHLPDVSATKPSIYHIGSLDDIPPEGTDYVSVPYELYTAMNAALQANQSDAEADEPDD